MHEIDPDHPIYRLRDLNQIINLLRELEALCLNMDQDITDLKKRILTLESAKEDKKLKVASKNTRKNKSKALYGMNCG